MRHLTVSATLSLLAAAGCSGERPAPQPTATPTADVTTNETRSVMRPAVIAEIKPEPAPVVEPRPLPSPTIAFEQGAALDEAAGAALDALLADPALPADARFVLRGHSDTMGSDRENLVTSRRRAEAVAAYLEKGGVGADRIEVIALGERRPLVPNAKLDGSDDPQARVRNRRVDIEVIAPPEAEPKAPAAAAANEQAPDDAN